MENTAEPKHVTNAKLNLKRTKRFASDIEHISQHLHSSQCDILNLSTKLSEHLKNVQISDISDKFGIFCNNIGLAISSNNIKEQQEMHLMNMEDQFIKPLTQFNKNTIAKSQKLHKKLKKSVNTNNKNINKNNSNTKKELLNVQNEFIDSIKEMESQKRNLTSTFQLYFRSYVNFTKHTASNVKLYNKQMHSTPATAGNFSIKLPSKDESELKTKEIVKEGWMKKRGGLNPTFKKRYFKLFRNKKLKYFDKPNGENKGHADFTNIIKMNMENNENDNKYIFSVYCENRIWIFELDNIKNRNEWYKCIEFMCFKNLKSGNTPLSISLEGPAITMMSVDETNKYLSKAQREYIRSKPGYQGQNANILNTPVVNTPNSTEGNIISLSCIKSPTHGLLSIISDSPMVIVDHKHKIQSPLPAYHVSN
eukprot:368799_1